MRLTSFSLSLLMVGLMPSSIGASRTEGATAVAVTVSGPGGALSGAYVALVADDEPWQRPTAEALTDDDGRAYLPAAAGAYELIAAAPRLQSHSEKVTLIAGKHSAVAVSMPPVMDASGHIEDTEGRPIAGARVSTIRAAVQPPIGTFSELAWNSVAPAERTTTDADGWFRLPVPSTKRMAILIEARGYAPAWRTTSPEEDPSEMKITLRPGASLRVALDRTEPHAMVVVRGVNSNAPEGGVPAEWQERVWARRASDGVLTRASSARRPGERRSVRKCIAFLSVLTWCPGISRRQRMRGAAFVSPCRNPQRPAFTAAPSQRKEECCRSPAHSDERSTSHRRVQRVAW
jgi:hypothetical protein